MSDTNLTEALTLLLSNARLREEYREDAERVARELSVVGTDMVTFLNLDLEQLDAQAEGLISKRFYETSRLLPITLRHLDIKGRTLFWEHAAKFWPTGHQRHLVDAVEFCRYLDDDANAFVCRTELNWIRFVLSQKWIALHFVSEQTSGEHRRAIQVFYRNRKRPSRFLIRFGF